MMSLWNISSNYTHSVTHYGTKVLSLSRNMIASRIPLNPPSYPHVMHASLAMFSITSDNLPRIYHYGKFGRSAIEEYSNMNPSL
jgi:hypothetical protein